MKLNRIFLAVDHGAPSWAAARLTAHLAPRLKAAVGGLTVLALALQKRSARDQRIREYVAALKLAADITQEMLATGVRARAQVRAASGLAHGAMSRSTRERWLSPLRWKPGSMAAGLDEDTDQVG